MLVRGTPSSQDAEKVHSFLKRIAPGIVEVYVAIDDMDSVGQQLISLMSW